MKIYFTASLRGKKEFGDNYSAIVGFLTKLGHRVVSDHIIKTDPEKVGLQDQKEMGRIYHQLSQALRDSDIVVAEISHQSISVGHEISLALELSKPVIALYTGGNTTPLISGKPDDRLQVLTYQDDNLDSILQSALSKAEEKIDVRFNFFVTPKILAYLDWLTKEKKLPRSVYLRNLIEADMKRNKEYEQDNQLE